MKSAFVCLLLAATFALSQSAPDPKAQAKILESYGKLPMSFEANHGQTDSSVKFLSRTAGYSLFLTDDEAVFAFNEKTDEDAASHATGVLRMKLRNANVGTKVSGADQVAGTSNYFIGNDRAKWRTTVPNFARVKYEGIYSGIDLIYYGNRRQLEYDFIVAPGEDPRRIAFDVRGAEQIRRDGTGQLVIKMKEGEIHWHEPVAYQEKDGVRRLIAARYVIRHDQISFEISNYDSTLPLTIDPALVYSTYLGGSGDDQGNAIAVDTSGNAYVVGTTDSINFPTANSLQGAYGGEVDAFVAKINSSGSALVYSTYLGGGGVDYGYGIAVDGAGNAYLTGYTQSSDFPAVNPLQGTIGGAGDAFATKLNPAGSALIYSTYLGGSGNDLGFGIAVDGTGSAYVTGNTNSSDFPTLNALQPTGAGGGDGFISKLNATGSALVYSTYLGGTERDYGSSIAVDSVGSAYITGLTGSTDFPTKSPLQATNAGGDPGCACDSFVTKLNPAGSALVYSTYLGGNGIDYGSGIAVDSAGNAYIVGSTDSTNFPTENPLQATNRGGYDAFVFELNATGSALVYSTYLGGQKDDYGNGIAVDSVGNAYVAGETSSTDFPKKSPLQNKNAGQDDAFISMLNPTGSALIYSTNLGGSLIDASRGVALDGAGNAYITGSTQSVNFPTSSPLQPGYGGSQDAILAKISTTGALATVTTTILSSSPNPSLYGQVVTFTAKVSSSAGPPPDGEAVTFIKGTAVLGEGTLSSGSASFGSTTLKVGKNAVSADYVGDPKFAFSKSTALSQVVDKASTATALVSSLNPSNVAQSVTFTATVTPQFGGTVSGTVSFYDGATLLKTATVSGGVAKYTTAKLAIGKHGIAATYKGSTDFDSSSASLTQTVN